eukprot:scaffold384898_cov19-Prasinocladus_malaysianus.AAC.1
MAYDFDGWFFVARSPIPEKISPARVSRTQSTLHWQAEIDSDACMLSKFQHAASLHNMHDQQ